MDRPTANEPVVLYDDDCGFCKRLLSKFLAWDRRGVLRPVALQDPEADGLLGEMAEERKMASWHLVTPDGEVRSGGAAVAPLLRLLPGGGGPAWIVDRIPTLTDRSYRWVAANRTALSRRLPRRESGKRRAERRIESHSGPNSSSPGTSAPPASPPGAGDPPGAD